MLIDLSNRSHIKIWCWRDMQHLTIFIGMFSQGNRYLALVLSLLMFMTSCSYSVNLHYCQSELQTFSIWGKAKSCHELKNTCPHHTHQSAAQEPTGCCNDETIEVESMDEEFDFGGSLDLGLTLPIAVRVFSNSIEIASFDQGHLLTPSSKYQDFLPGRDIYVWLGRYLL